METMGNANAALLYASMPGAPPKPDQSAPAHLKERYIRDKYERLKWVDPDFRAGQPPRAAKKHRASPVGSPATKPRRARPAKQARAALGTKQARAVEAGAPADGWLDDWSTTATSPTGGTAAAAAATRACPGGKAAATLGGQRGGSTAATKSMPSAETQYIQSLVRSMGSTGSRRNYGSTSRAAVSLLDSSNLGECAVPALKPTTSSYAPLSAARCSRRPAARIQAVTKL